MWGGGEGGVWGGGGGSGGGGGGGGGGGAARGGGGGGDRATGCWESAESKRALLVINTLMSHRYLVTVRQENTL